MKTNLVLIRHGQSLWNKINQFTGLTDILLSEKGIQEATDAADTLCKENLFIDIAYTSSLSRAITTCNLIMEKQHQTYWANKYSEDAVYHPNDSSENKIKKKPVYKSDALNERDYGELTGKNKTEVAEKYGKESVHRWRRGFYECPPGGENLEDVCKRVSKYFHEEIKDNLENKNILIAAHGNSLRALLVVLGLFDEKTIEKVEIPTGKPLVITFEYGEMTDCKYFCPIHFSGRQILDSRGNPTVEVDVLQNDKLLARESAPSGASTGTNEARELRDDGDVYNGKGVLIAVNNVEKFSKFNFLKESDITDLTKFDKELCRFDGTVLKENMGGNATTALSFAAAAGGAKLEDKELFQHFRNLYFSDGEKYKFNTLTYNLPTPMVNILNGGKHAGGKLKIQEFMIMPRDDISFHEKLHNVNLVYHKLGKLLIEKYGVSAKNLGDEGGFAPQLTTPEEAINIIEMAITEVNLVPGKDIFLALDCAASEYYHKDKQRYEITEGVFLDRYQLCNYYKDLFTEYPALKSIEDPFDEYDYEAWELFMTEIIHKLPNPIMVVGDDLFTTNSETVKKGITNNWANSLLLKVNQIGTITEAVEAAKLMFQNNMDVIVSHRSGETTSTLISDLAVGIGAKYIKTGAPARGERVVKYNRLLQIEEYLKKSN